MFLLAMRMSQFVNVILTFAPLFSLHSTALVAELFIVWTVLSLTPVPFHTSFHPPTQTGLHFQTSAS